MVKTDNALMYIVSGRTILRPLIVEQTSRSHKWDCLRIAFTSSPCSFHYRSVCPHRSSHQRARQYLSDSLRIFFVNSYNGAIQKLSDRRIRKASELYFA